MNRIVDVIGSHRKLLFVLGNLVACAVVVGALIMPIVDIFDERDARIAQRSRMLARLTSIADQASNIRSIAADTKQQLQGGEFLIGPNESVISADLQTRLKTMTGSAGAQARTVQALPVKSAEQVKYSGSRIEIVGSLQSIVRAVHAIESAKPYLFVAGAVVKLVPSYRQGGPEEPVIQAQLDVFGAMQVGDQP